MPVYKSYEAALPSGPTVELPGLCRRLGLFASVVAKLEFFGPTGNQYDRVAAGMAELCLSKGLDKKAGLIEASSGAFALSLAIAAARQGIRLQLCVPQSLSEGRRRLFAGLGAELHLVTGGRNEAEALASSLAVRSGGVFLNYLENDDNPEVHRRTTGPELLSACTNLDFLVCGVASGGTISGTGEYIKGWTNGTLIYAVEPYESQVLTGGFAGKHGITGLGLPFVPGNYNPYIIDGVIPVKTGDAAALADTVLFTDGVPCSIAAGAVLAGACVLAAEEQNAGKTIAAVLPSRKFF